MNICLFVCLQVISQLSLELDDIARRLREAGRSRENKLKQAKAPEGRVTMPFLLKSMDEVSSPPYTILLRAYIVLALLLA